MGAQEFGGDSAVGDHRYRPGLDEVNVQGQFRAPAIGADDSRPDRALLAKQRHPAGPPAIS